MGNFNSVDDNNFQNLDVISNLVSELFNHINSKDNFNYISNLLISSLSNYKKRFSSEPENVGNAINEINKSEFNSVRYNINDSSEYLSILNDIHSILSNCPDLTNTQKLDFCTNQRYFMKLYLKEILKKINTSLDH